MPFLLKSTRNVEEPEFLWRLWPNPPWEIITLQVDRNSPSTGKEFAIQNIALITKCVPENEHFAGILALAVLGYVRFLRSRKA